MKLRVRLAAALLSTLLWTAPACADDADEDDDSSDTVSEQSQTGAPAKLGLVHDTLRRSGK